MSAPPTHEATGSTAGSTADLATAAYLLRLADDTLVLAQRLGAQLTRAPQLEEDVALSNIALDLLGQARPLLTRVGRLDGTGRDEDALAYLRDEREFVSCQLVEVAETDFADTIARQLLFSCFHLPLLHALVGSTDEVLAGVAQKGVKEVAYHRDHAVQWTVRLGDGTQESHDRMQAALGRMWRFVPELFESDEVSAAAVEAGVGADPAALRPGWDADVDAVLAASALERPTTTRTATGGRRGIHTETFGFMVAEMQHVHRSHPGAQW